MPAQELTGRLLSCLQAGSVGHNKTHSCATLFALLRNTVDFIISSEAMDVYVNVEGESWPAVITELVTSP